MSAPAAKDEKGRGGNDDYGGADSSNAPAEHNTDVGKLIILSIL